MNYCLFASKQGLLFESHALFEGVNIIGMGVNIVRIRSQSHTSEIVLKLVNGTYITADSTFALKVTRVGMEVY